MKKIWVCKDKNYIYAIGNKSKVIDAMLNEWFDGNDEVHCVKICTKKLYKLKKALDIIE